MIEARNFLRQIRAYDCAYGKQRIGRQSDGGYVVLPEICKLVKQVVSCGVGNDISFELDFVKHFPQAKIDLYDPTIDALPKEHDNFIFHKEEFNPDPHKPCGELLKMDIEGAEWKAFSYTGLSHINLIHFHMIVIEFHFLHVEAPNGHSPYFTGLYQNWADKANRENFRIFGDVLRRLNAYFYCFHVHANNSLGMVNLYDYQFPPLVEMSFLRRNLWPGPIRPSKGPFPIPELDFPNKMDRPDINLGELMERKWKKAGERKNDAR